jgi:hypothetical protein
MQCDDKPRIRQERVDFVRSSKAAYERFLEARFWIVSGLPTVQNLVRIGRLYISCLE